MYTLTSSATNQYRELKHLNWSDFIRVARKRLHLTQAQFAKRLGVSQARASRIEKSMPRTLSMQFKVARVLKLDYQIPKFACSL